MKVQFEELVEHLMEKGFFLEEAVELLEEAMIQRALAMSAGNQCAASKALGIHRNTLQRKMIAYQLRRKPPTAVANSLPPLKQKSS